MIFRMSSTRSFLLDEAKRIWGQCFLWCSKTEAIALYESMGLQMVRPFPRFYNFQNENLGFAICRNRNNHVEPSSHLSYFLHFFILPLTSLKSTESPSPYFRKQTVSPAQLLWEVHCLIACPVLAKVLGLIAVCAIREWWTTARELK